MVSLCFPPQRLFMFPPDELICCPSRRSAEAECFPPAASTAFCRTGGVGREGWGGGGRSPPPFVFLCSFAFFRVSPFPFHLSCRSLVSPERLEAASQNVVPLQVIPAFTANVKHCAFPSDADEYGRRKR